MSLDAFKKHLAGAIPGKPMDEADSTGPMKTDEGMSPGEQAMAAIKSGDATALEEAIRRCVEQNY